MIDVDDLRPGFHFSPRRNWMNDPNGLVYFRELWHIFYQYNPEGNDWGNMSWGHATSPDLCHWTELPVAIRYDEREAIYSGSIVVDHENSSGFSDDDHPPLVAIYTSAYPGGRQAQSLAYSLDAGSTWTKYAGNPVIDRDSDSFRDPKVIRFEGSDGVTRWIMVVADAVAQQLLFYSSPNLIEWTFLSTFGPFGGEAGLWECPDLFWLPIDGEADRGAWVLVVSLDPGLRDGGSSTRYLIGEFDGRRFHASGAEVLRRLDGGRDLYAAVTFDNAPEQRRILLGWMSNWNYAAHIPTPSWRGTMSMPRELGLRVDSGNVVLTQRPVRELGAIAIGGGGRLRPFDLGGRRPLTNAIRYRLDVEFKPDTATHVGVEVLVGDGEATVIEYEMQSEMLVLDRSRSGRRHVDPSFPSRQEVSVPLHGAPLRLTVLVDRTSVEVFAQDGSACLTDQVFAAPESTLILVTSRGGLTRVTSCELTTLDDIWQREPAVSTELAPVE